MKTILLAATAALVSAPSFAAPMTPLQRETAAEQAFKDKSADAFKAMMAPNYVGIGDTGPCSVACEVQDMRKVNLRSFKIGNFHSQMIGPETMLNTYSLDGNGMTGKKPFKVRFWSTTLWHRSGDKWLAVYHSGVKAK